MGTRDCQHLLVLGADDGDMARAARAVQDLGGGFAVAAGGRVVASVLLPPHGLLSERSGPELVDEIEAALHVVRALDCRLSAAFHTLAFLGPPVVIGKLKICSAGLVDVWAGRTVPLEVGLAEPAPSPSLSRSG